MLQSVNFKIILATIITFISTMSFAASTQMDCAVSEPPNMFHDVIITNTVTNEEATITVAYSYPGMREDKWYGPFKGEYHSEIDRRIFTFEDGTVISLNRQDRSGRFFGQVTLGLDGRQAEISCNKPY